MILEFVVWFGLLLIACTANVARTVAAHARDLKPTLLPAQLANLRHIEMGGTVIGILALAGAAAVAVVALAPSHDEILPAALGAGASVLLVLAAQRIARGSAHRHMDRLARPLLGDAVAFLPLIEQHTESSEPEQEREALEQIVDAGEKAGLIESDEHDMITAVMRLDRTVAREIMVPRIDVVGIEIETPLRSALDVIIAGSHSRVPVYEENIDHVAGLVYAKDLLKLLRDGKMDEPLRAALRRPHFVPESQPVDELLQEMQKAKVHMAIVIDEYGGTAGIVTIEDVLEEIVGEIQDEFDVGEEPLVERLGAEEGIFNARVSITDVNDALAVSLPGESDTLGGLVYQRLQKMPKVGDQVLVDGVTISVLSVAGRRIKKVRVSKAKNEPEREPSAAENETTRAQ